MCHYVCWMAPFMVLGTALKNILKWPSLHLKANIEQCINCKCCNKACPMSLPVNEMVQRAAMQHSECILCGECVEICPKDVIRYTFSRPQ
ncbi:4Fe-4S ferredoxin iron-sulfur binding domain protein [Candidatus Vecturithrix granuli]|uniref:4Fe-4S ferredoxin iron-sulfur binding domain protein n=1 Tax=Vecturithrix granuli TaxID=1499967 RepID=A0A081BXL5_VECG1|nr:4Fe-4S ferredoxin iron-sulfur binding domain protein [Candidatus Vecturithrix granuli]